MELGTEHTMFGKKCCGVGGGWHSLGCPSRLEPRLRTPIDCLPWGGSEALKFMPHVLERIEKWRLS